MRQRQHEFVALNVSNGQPPDSVDVRSVARDLRVRYVLEGSVRREKARVAGLQAEARSDEEIKAAHRAQGVLNMPE